MKILVTGAAGFIGYHVCKSLLEDGHVVIGVDDFREEYYSKKLKWGRIQELGFTDEPEVGEVVVNRKYTNFIFCDINIADWLSLEGIFEEHKNIEVVIHLAASASVPYSVKNPYAVLENNIKGMHNILEACREYKVPRILYASSASVYGEVQQLPVTINTPPNPTNLYGVSKLTNEYQARVYSTTYGIETIGMRFFNVYGEWGRPDSAVWKFTKSILQDTLVELRGEDMVRGFTYVEDVVKAVKTLLTISIHNPWIITNVGGDEPTKTEDMLRLLQRTIGKSTLVTYVRKSVGEIDRMWADGHEYSVETSLEDGLQRFVEWYKQYS